jgi:hypothetical protein
MMQVVPRWKVTVFFADRGDLVFWLSDGHLGNVLRLVSGMQFSENGLDQPQAVTVQRDDA